MERMTRKLKIILILLTLSSLSFGYFFYNSKSESSSHTDEITIKNEKIKQLEKEVNRLQNKSIVNLLLEKLKEKQSTLYKVSNSRNHIFTSPIRKSYQPRNSYTNTNNYKRTYTYNEPKLLLGSYYSIPSTITKQYPAKIYSSNNTETTYQYNNKNNSSSNYSSKNFSNYCGFTNPNHEYVSGYTKSNGTRVEGYYRTQRNSNKSDNFSSKGNINPYTGKKGYK